MSGKSNIAAESLRLDCEVIYKIFESNATKGDSLLAIVASGLLADMVQMNKQASNYII